MSRVLTARFVATVAPKRTRQEIADAGCLGLYLIVQPTGAKSWAARYRRPDGRSAKLTIGSVADYSLAAARAAAAAARDRVDQGADPASRRQVSVATAGDSVAAHAAQFLVKYVGQHNRKSTARSSEYTFNNIVLPAWRGRSVQDIHRRDVIELVETTAGDRGPFAARKLTRTLSKFFGWLLTRDVVEASPCPGVSAILPRQPKPRERVLTDLELAALLKAADTDHPSDRAVWVLVLTGARRTEVGGMRWTELDPEMRTWTINAERSKNHRAHVVPLPAQAWEIIDARPRIAGCDFVFTTSGQRPINGWYKVKRRLSAKAGLVEKSWRIHDLRRTTASGLQRKQFKTRTEAIERVLNHRSGTFKGVIGIYQTDPLEPEVRTALQKWADFIEELVSGKPARRPKVVALRRRIATGGRMQRAG
jgi:integrase